MRLKPIFLILSAFAAGVIVSSKIPSGREASNPAAGSLEVLALVATQDLPKGHRLKPGDLARGEQRVDSSPPAQDRLQFLWGVRLKRAVQRGESVPREWLELRP